jgi:hypothetical protein
VPEILVERIRSTWDVHSEVLPPGIVLQKVTVFESIFQLGESLGKHADFPLKESGIIRAV